MRNKLILFTLLLLSSFKGFSGGKIVGKVTDELNGETIIGAIISIKGTTLGAATDIDGNFSINIDADTCTLVINYFGYQSKEINGISLSTKEPTKLNIALGKAKATDLHEVVVRSSLKKENIAALYTIQKNAAGVSDGISADVIKKSPDRNTAEVLKRVSGTTVKDDKFIIIRGLSDRYNTALIDNAILPSTEANTKAFSFDIIPANMIDNIVISKAATPDLPGDFAGGAINILTKEIPENNFAIVAVGGGYNSVSTFKPLKSGVRSGLDFLGYDDGMRQLPKDNAFPKNAEQTNALGAADNIKFVNEMPQLSKVNERNALPNMGINASLGRVKDFNKGRKFGAVFAVNYGHRESITPEVVRDWFQYNYKDVIYKYSTNTGMLANFTYVTPKSKISFKNIYNKIFDDQFLYREGISELSSKQIKYYAFDLIQKSLLKTSLEGSHKIGDGQSKINWNGSYCRITNNQPNQTKITYSREVSLINTDNPYYAEVSSLSKLNNKYYSTLSENIYTAGANYNLPFDLFKQTQIFKAGFTTQYRQRDFNARFLGLVLDDLKIDPNEANEIKKRPIESLYGKDLVDKGYYKLAEIYDPSNIYSASSLNNAGYVMLDNHFTEKLRLVWGVRTEVFHLQLDSKDNTGPLSISRDWTDVLPSANFTYALNEKSNLRLSYFRSVARPEFREVAPFAYYDYELPANSYGNVKLNRTTIDNMDVRYEIYPSNGQIISISGFYKKFTDPIEPKLYDVNSSGIERTFVNSPSAQNFGGEIEIRKSLEFINKKLSNLFFYTNAAYIYSKVELNNVSTVTGQKVGESDRPLAGQSPYVINAGLNFVTLENKLSLNMLYNRIGRRIYLVSGQLLPSVWDNPRDVLDFQANYKITKHSDISLNVKDIFNQNYVLYFDYTDDKKYNPNTVKVDANGNQLKDETFQKYKLGTTFSLVYTYKF